MADVVINVGAVSAITAGTGLTGGTITGTGTIAADFGTTAGTICQGNDARLTAPVAPLAHASSHTEIGSDPLTLTQSQITGLSASFAAKVATTRQVVAGTGLSGGGALSADVTLNTLYGTSASTACVGNDARLSNARTPDTHASSHATGGSDVLTLGQAQISGLVTALSNKALGATVMTAGTGLTGGGDLSAGRIFAVDFGATSTTATVGNDSRLSFIASGAGATSRTLQNKLRDVVSVKDFGATGDGSTDDTVTIQLALTAGAGKSVYFPTGTYITSAGLNVSPNTYVYSDGGSANISVQPTASAATFNQGLILTGSGITISGLKISGTNEYSFVGGARTEYASAISLTSGTAKDIDILDCQIFGWGWGMYLRRVSNWRIIGNRCWGGEQTSTTVPVPDNSCWDISVASSSEVEGNKGRRGIIANNFCLSNVDTGIGVGGNSASDQDVIIHNNVVQPLQTDGITPLTNLNNRSRYGITTSYNGTAPVRFVVSGNIVRDVSLNGIYVQGNTMPTGDVAITGNMVSNCGFNTTYPEYASLKGGIWALGGADSISGNVIVDCYVAGIVYTTLQVDPSPAGVQLPRSVIGNNNISRILTDPNVGSPESGYGVYLTGYNNSRILVSGNRIQKTAHNSINGIVINNNADNGGIHIVGNLVEVDHAKGAISLSQGGASVSQSSITANHIVGSDNSTNSTFNAGIRINGKIHCVGNTIRNFHRGIESQFTTRVLDVQCSSNAIANCFYGITGQDEAGPWLVTANTFTNVTGRECHAAPYQGVLFKSTGDSQPATVQITRNAVPTTGTWVVGDYCKNTAVVAGQPKGWYCTVAGTGAGATWVSEGNLINPLTVTELNALPAGVKIEGAMGFCTDATVTTFASTVAGGGSNNVPVYYDGSAWKIG
jgi:hypothetical protein